MDKLKNSILDKFKEISKRFFLMQKEIVTTLKINKSEYKVLTFLALHNEMTQTILGEACGFDKPATSRIVLKLLLQGYILKTYKKGNKKNIYISLSEKGKEKAKLIGDELCKIREKYFKELSQKETNIFLSLLDKSLNLEAQNA